MCGRARLSSDVSEIKLVFSIPPERPAPNFPPSWNVAPTDSLPVVRYDTKAGQRSLDMLRWGLIGEEAAHVRQLKSLPAPYPAAEMICGPVSARVGNVRNNDAKLIEPVTAA
jgi:putative SOS response-associated peptidase YedK